MGPLFIKKKYSKDLLKKFDMDKAKSISTPMYPSQVLEVDKEGYTVSRKLYRGMIGSLLYLYFVSFSSIRKLLYLYFVSLSGMRNVLSMMLQVIVMPTLLETELREKAQVVVAIFLGNP